MRGERPRTTRPYDHLTKCASRRWTRAAHLRVVRRLQRHPTSAWCRLVTIANSAGDLRDEDAAHGADMLRQRKTEQGELERSAAQTIEKLNGHAAGLAQREDRAVRRARGLGWFSVALGALQIVAPRAALSMAGVRVKPRTATTMRLRGLRELASGVGILRNTRPAAVVMGARGGRCDGPCTARQDVGFPEGRARTRHDRPRVGARRDRPRHPERHASGRATNDVGLLNRRAFMSSAPSP